MIFLTAKDGSLVNLDYVDRLPIVQLADLWVVMAALVTRPDENDVVIIDDFDNEDDARAFVQQIGARAEDPEPSPQPAQVSGRPALRFGLPVNTRREVGEW